MKRYMLLLWMVTAGFVLDIVCCANSSMHAPSIENPEEKTYVRKVNESVLLACKVKIQYKDTRRNILFHWKKHQAHNGSVIWNWPRYRIKQNKGLRIRKLQKHDAGIYYCNAISFSGQTSVKRILEVTGNSTYQLPIRKKPFNREELAKVIFPPIDLEVTSQLVRKVFYAGTRGRLKCAIESSSQVKIEWWFKGIHLRSSDDYYVKEPSLILTNITERIAGNYTCVATNTVRTARMVVEVTVKKRSAQNLLPKAIIQTLYAKQGENITFECTVPAARVSLLHWHSPRKRIAHQEPRQNDLGHLIRQHDDSSPVENNTRVRRIFFVNVSKEVHEGEYKCLALLKKDKSPTTVKIVHLIVQRSSTVLLYLDDSPVPLNPDIAHRAKSSLLVIIVVPVLAGFISMAVILACVRRYKNKSGNRESIVDFPEHKKEVDEDDVLSLQLSAYPTGSLRIHNKYQLAVKYPETCHTFFIDSDINASSRTIDHNALSVSDGYYAVRAPKLSYSSNNRGDSSIQSDLKQECCLPVAQWPGKRLSPGDSDYISFDERDELLLKKEKSRSKPTNNNESKQDRMKPLLSDNSFGACCGVLDDNIPYLDISDSPEQDDQLLKREMKKWEVLIKNKTAENKVLF